MDRAAPPLDPAPGAGRAHVALAHHHPADHDRCVVLAGRLVCRRCLVLHPVAVLVAVVAVAVGDGWPAATDAWLLGLAPLPVVAEWVGEHLGLLGHRPRRLVATSALAAVALGRGYARYLADPSDGLFWTMVLGFGLVCGLSAVAGTRRGPALAPLPPTDAIPPPPASSLPVRAER